MTSIEIVNTPLYSFRLTKEDNSGKINISHVLLRCSEVNSRI